MFKAYTWNSPDGSDTTLVGEFATKQEAYRALRGVGGQVQEGDDGEVTNYTVEECR